MLIIYKTYGTKKSAEADREQERFGISTEFTAQPKTKHDIQVETNGTPRRAARNQ